MLVHMIQGDVCSFVCLVGELRVSKIFKIRLVGQSFLSGTSLSFYIIKFLFFQFMLMFGVFQNLFFVNQINPFSFASVNQSLKIYQELFQYFSRTCSHFSVSII